MLAALRDSGDAARRQELSMREVEVSLEAQITPRLYGLIFMSRPEGEPFGIEEAAAIVDLPWDSRLKAGKYRNEFGILNTIHEPERPQITLPLPVEEFLGAEQLKESSVTLGKVLNMGGEKRAAISLALLNAGNETIFEKGSVGGMAYASKLYYGFHSDALAYRLGISALGGRAADMQALDFHVLIDPFYSEDTDSPARFSVAGEVLFNRRKIAPANFNNARGFWTVADYQFQRRHHIGIGAEYTEGRLDNATIFSAYSAHYSWYYSRHSRLQLMARRVDANGKNGGMEFLLQWNLVLSPHSEKPFMDVMRIAAGH